MKSFHLSLRIFDKQNCCCLKFCCKIILWDSDAGPTKNAPHIVAFWNKLFIRLWSEIYIWKPTDFVSDLVCVNYCC